MLVRMHAPPDGLYFPGPYASSGKKCHYPLRVGSTGSLSHVHIHISIPTTLLSRRKRKGVASC